MKIKNKLFSIFLTCFLSLPLFTVRSCSAEKQNSTPFKQEKEIKKDIRYYQNVISYNEKLIKEIELDLVELNKEKISFPKDEFNNYVTEMQAEIATYEATIAEAKYQIWLIKENQIINEKNKKGALKLLQLTKDKWQLALNLKNKYYQYQNKKELKRIELKIEQLTAEIQKVNYEKSYS